MTPFTKKKLEVFREDYRKWGSSPLNLNIFDLIFLASSKAKYDFETGKTRGAELKTYAFELLNKLKILLQKSQNPETAEESWAEMQYYIKIARNIVKGKRMEEEEQVSFTASSEIFSYKDDLEQLQKEITEDAVVIEEEPQLSED